MKISVFGLGYVGSVTAACFAHCGHSVIGIDVKDEKNYAINQGKSPVFEPGLTELIHNTVESGFLSATNDVNTAIQEAEISFICVGTPTNPEGSLNLMYIQEVCREIGKVLENIDKYHIVVIRSTVLPGSTENSIIPIIEQFSGKKVGIDFGMVVNPEFMREGQAIHDFFHPERIVIGSIDEKCGNIIRNFYVSCNIDATIIQTEIRVAEIVKYVDNSFHAIKVTFANEIGSICRLHGIDSHEVMSIFLLDKKLNLSPYYFKPGFAFGGSCLPKDVAALRNRAKELRLNCPLIDSIIPSNEEHINRAVSLIVQENRKRIGIFGLAFKNNTSDIRNSATIALINRLFDLGYKRFYDKGYTIQIYDPNYKQLDIDNLPPHIPPLLNSSMDDTVLNSDILVITIADEKFRNIPDLVKEDQILIDLVNIIKKEEIIKGKYLGICW